MAYNINFVNAQLRRTLPKLSGNMKLDMIVSLDSDKRAFVKQAHLRPISPLINYAPVVDERIMDRPHQLNIRRFYERTRSQFYEHIIDSRLASDWPTIIPVSEIPDLKYIKEFDDTYFAGCQRMSHKLYGCTHEVLVPVWLDQARGLRFTINILPYGSEKAQQWVLDITPEYYYKHLEASVPFHNDFVKYMLDYFDYAGISEGNNNVMTVNFAENISTLRGLAVETGNIQTRQNLNIAKNLIWRTRPLLESNSLLTNTFMDYKMIVTQLINFNICLNLSDDFEIDSYLNSNASKINNKFKVWVEVSVQQALCDTKDGSFEKPNWANLKETAYWQNLGANDGDYYDFYTNHHYVPRIYVNPDNPSNNGSVVYADKDNIKNALSFKRDFECTDLIHKNKMAQSICHWFYAEQSRDVLFNVYDGFGAYTDDAEYPHGFGTSFDINDDVYNEGADNTIWAGVPAVGTGDDMAERLHTPIQFVQSGYFRDTRSFVEGIQFGYDPSKVEYPADSERQAPKAVYVATMTTPWDTHLGAIWSKQTTPIDPKMFIGILTDRALPNDNGESTLPKTQSLEEYEFDKRYDWHNHSDVDNRWVVSKIIKGVDHRAYIDTTGKYMKKNVYIWLPVDVNAEDKIPNETIRAAHRNLGVVWDLGVSEGITPSMLTRIGGTASRPDYSGRNHDNSNVLYVGFLRGRDPKEEDRGFHPDDPLYVIFHNGRSIVQYATKDLVHRDILPHGLTLGGVRSALKDYMDKYKPIYEAIQVIQEKEGDDPNVWTPGGNIPDMNDFGVIADLFSNIQPPEIIFFDRSITQLQDVTLSTRATEHTYRKFTNANEWVYRYSGAIRPAIYPEKTFRRNPEAEAELRYRGWYGRNFLWQKKPIFTLGQTFPSSLGQYINRNIPPTYPSLDYDSVKPLIITNEYGGNDKLTITVGDLRYTEVPPIYRGFTDSGRDKMMIPDEQIIDPKQDKSPISPDDVRRWLIEGSIVPGVGRYVKSPQTSDIAYWLYMNEHTTYAWPEFKWFNESVATRLPKTIQIEVGVDKNEKAALDAEAIGKLTDYLNAEFEHSLNKIQYDKAFVRKVYDLEFNLISIGTDENGKVLYKYDTIATLK